MKKGGIIDTARRLRRDMTDAERCIWALLRQPPFLAYRFRRQVPFDRYIADFASHPLKLVIEVDGSQHLDNPRDAVRTRFLESRGYRVVRFWNRDVLMNRATIGEALLRELRLTP